MRIWELVLDPSRKVNHLSKIIWDRKVITEFTRSIISTRIGKPVLMMDVKVSKDKSISRWVDRGNVIYTRWNRIKNRAQRRRRWSIDKKDKHFRTSIREHGTKTTPIFLPADGEASWSLFPSSVSLLSGGTVQPENSYSHILKVTGPVWESQKRISINTSHSYYQRSSP